MSGQWESAWWLGRSLQRGREGGEPGGGKEERERERSGKKKKNKKKREPTENDVKDARGQTHKCNTRNRRRQCPSLSASSLTLVL